MKTTRMDSTGSPMGSRIREIIGSVSRPDAPAVAVPASSEPITISMSEETGSVALYICATKQDASAKYMMLPKRSTVRPSGNTRSTMFSPKPRLLSAEIEDGMAAKLFRVAKQIITGSITFFSTSTGLFMPERIQMITVQTSIAASPAM